MEKPSLLNLSDEILLYIFSYLDGTDKINTFYTCMRFANVLCDRKLSRKLKLIGNYSVTLKDIKCYLKPKMMRQSIRILDLTNCYWLLPSEICATVMNLKSLIAFYSVDIAFTFSQIVKIVNGLPKLKYLSFSWPEVTNIKEVNDDCLSTLVFLYICFPKLATINWLHFFYWIYMCRSLKQLWLINTPGNNSPKHLYTLVLGQNPCSQLVLDTLVIVCLQNQHILQRLRSMCKVSAETCKCLWLPNDMDVWQEYFNENEDKLVYPHLSTSWGTCLENLACENQRITLGEKGKMKRFYWRIFKPPFCAGDEQFENLEELGIEYCFSFTLLQPLHMLTVLCIPTCCFSDPGEQKEETRLLPKWCPKIQHLELYLCEKCKNRSQKNEFLLEMIAEWPKLKTLKLSDCWNLRSGKAFDNIFKSCKNLEKLFLRNLGALCGYVFEFTKALKNCKNLKDFRLEENYVPHLQTTLLFETLVECPLIERVAVVFRNNDKGPTEASVLNLIEKSSKLIFLCLITPSIMEAQRKRLMKVVTKRFTSERPALRCCFMKCLENTEKEKLPAIHLFEMLYPDISGPFQLPYKKDFFFEVPNLDVAAIKSTLKDDTSN